MQKEQLIKTALVKARQELEPGERMLMVGEELPLTNMRCCKFFGALLTGSLVLVILGLVCVRMNLLPAVFSWFVVFCSMPLVLLIPFMPIVFVLDTTCGQRTSSTRLYVLTSDRVLKFENGSVEVVAARAAIEKIESANHRIALTMSNGETIRLSAVEGLHLSPL